MQSEYSGKLGWESFSLMKNEVNRWLNHADVLDAGKEVMDQLSWAIACGAETLTDNLLPSDSSEAELYYNENPENYIQFYFPSM